MDFKDLLTKQGIDLDNVMVMRHRPAEPGMRKVLPWLAAERPEVFNAYQQTQNPEAEKVLKRAEAVASFIAQEGDKAVFVGIYRRKTWRSVTVDQCWAIPAIAELKPFGVGVPKHRETCLWFELELTDIYSECKGRLVVKWPPGRLWWRWAKSNNFPIHAIHEESLLDAELPSWDRLSLTWQELRVLPTKLKAALRQWRGIYYIFDVKLVKATSAQPTARRISLAAGRAMPHRATVATRDSKNGTRAIFYSQSSKGHRRTWSRTRFAG